ncbi:redoxin family protein [bacterium]|nr:redoxin family protein [bacterium]
MLRRIAIALALVVLSAAGALAQSADEQFQALFQKGIDQLEKRQYDDAVASFKKAIEIRKELPETYYNIACAYSLKGEKDKAIDWFADALAHGFNDEDHIAKDHDLDAIRDEARFKEVTARAFAKPRPGETLLTLKGEVASLEKLKGKVVLLDFWRTWCDPCKQEIPHLIALDKEYGAKGVVVVGVSNEPVPLQEQVADELKVSYLLLRQVGPLPAPFENVRAFPTLFILDQEGKVVKKLVGARERAEIEEALKPLLAPPEPPKKAPEPPEPQVF